MKVKLISESTGFGYSGKIANWIVSQEEHIQTLEKLQSGLTVEIPEKIAKNIFNLVDVETGAVISYVANLFITNEEVKKKYTDRRLQAVAPIKNEIKSIFNDAKQKSNSRNVSPIEEENE